MNEISGRSINSDQVSHNSAIIELAHLCHCSVCLISAVTMVIIILNRIRIVEAPEGNKRESMYIKTRLIG